MTQPDLPPTEGTTTWQRARIAHQTSRTLDREQRRTYESRFMAQERQRIAHQQDGRSDAARRATAWRTRTARRRLAAIAAVPFVAGLGVAVLDTVPEDDLGLTLLAKLALLLAMLGCLFIGFTVLRRATGALTESSENDLDERELVERRNAAVTSYQILLGCIGAVLILSMVDEFIDSWALTGEGWRNIILGLLLTATLLPAAVAAWRWPDPTDD